MSSEEKLVPKRRFREFRDAPAWEERKFAEVATTRRGLTYKPQDVMNGDNNNSRVLRSSNINGNTFEIHSDDVFVNKDSVNISYVRNGDILITAANGSSKLVGKHAIIHDIPEKSAVHGGFMLLAFSDNSEFLNALMGSPWYSKFINNYVVGGNGAIGNLKKNDLDSQIVYIPLKAEIKKIGKFFQNLDHLITLQQRKLDKLKNLKQAYLNEMFV